MAKKKLKIRVVKSAIIEMTKEEYDDLREACFTDGDRQMLNETVDLDCDGDLSLEVYNEKTVLEKV